MKNRILKSERSQLSDADITDIARELHVEEHEVSEMDQRMSGADQSLNSLYGDEDGSEWIDVLADPRSSQETNLGESEEYDERKAMLDKAMVTLSDREQEIIRKRMLTDNPATLEDLSQVYGVSRERIRQIEARAFEKLQQHVTGA